MIPEDKEGRAAQSKRAAPISLDKLLLVEGETPRHFFTALLKHLNIHEQIEIRSFGGVTELPGFLNALRRTPGFPGVG